MTLVVLPFACIGQYDYFQTNLLPFNEDGFNNSSCVEVVDDYYFTWGVQRDEIDIFPFVRKYDLDGTFVDTFYLESPDTLYYIGSRNSFRYVSDLGVFIAFNAIGTSNGPPVGYRFQVNLNLDGSSSQFYDFFPENNTDSFVGFGSFYGDHLVIGSLIGSSNAFASYFSKVDMEGNVIWTYQIPSASNQTYRVEDFVLFEDKILFSGFRRVSQTYHASYTLVDTTGNVIDEPFLTNNIGGNQALVTKSESDGILFAYTQNYEWNEEIGDPDIYWTELALSYFDTITNTVSEPIAHLNNYEYMVMKVRDVIPASDDGFVILGTSLNESFEFLSWVAKVNSDLELDWFQEYSYESCSSCNTEALDIDIAPDGGYVFTGIWQDINQGGFQASRAFLVKIDACGDFEWLGCEPVSVGLEEQSKLDFDVYPNPVEESFTIELTEPENAIKWTITDLQGRTVQEGVIDGFTTRVSLNLPSGLYVLMIETEVGEVGVKKVQVL